MQFLLYLDPVSYINFPIIIQTLPTQNDKFSSHIELHDILRETDLICEELKIMVGGSRLSRISNSNTGGVGI